MKKLHAVAGSRGGEGGGSVTGLSVCQVRGLSLTLDLARALVPGGGRWACGRGKVKSEKIFFVGSV